MYKFFIVFSLLLIVAGCQKTAPTGSPNGGPVASASAKRYPIKGRVISVDRPGKKISMQHDDIPGFMEAMTMDFPIHENWVWDEMAPGVEIRAELVVDNAGDVPFWIEKIGIIASGPNAGAPPINDEFAQVGRAVPEFSLTNQDGKRITVNDFRGKTLALTFIYARCPLPEYCIKMSTTFSDVARQLQADPDLKNKFRLLSISFDPANDTPEKLRSYGIGYMGNDKDFKFDVWQLAVGKDAEVRKMADFFGLRYEIDPQDKAKINHSLRTAVISPDGKVTKIISGNDWTPADLLRDMKAASSDTAK